MASGLWRRSPGGPLSDARALSPYIEKLTALRLIRVTRSLDAPPKARNQRLHLADPFLAFWHRFRLPNSSALAVGHVAEVYELAIEPAFVAYMGEIFEWIGREYVERYGSEILSAPAREVGKIWGDDYDLDVAATLLDGSSAFAEYKWLRAKVGKNVLRDLEAQVEKTSDGRGAATSHVMLVSRSGFTPDLKRAAAALPSVYLLGPDDLLG